MKKLLHLFLPAVLTLGLLAAPAVGQEEPVEEPVEEPTEPEPVYEELTYYFHGEEPVGELELGKLGHFAMTTDEPTGGQDKSMGVTNYVGGPNTKCSGNWLLPTWQGGLDGTVQKDLKVVLHTLAAPASTVNVQVFADGAGACNEAYVEPVAEEQVTLTGAEETEIVFSDVDFDVFDHLIVMVHGVDAAQARILYDSVAAPSRVELSCLLPEGKQTCVW